MPAQIRRLLRAEDIQCPAGRVAGEAGCFCTIEKVFIDGRFNPDSVGGYCMGGEHGDGWQECPTWRAEKEMEWKTGKGIDLEPTEVDRSGVEVTHTEKVVAG